MSVGVLMAVAMVIVPPVAARLLTSRIETMLLVAVGLGLLAGAVGLVASYHLAVPTGPAIALAAVAEVAVAAGARRTPRALRRRLVVDRPGHGAAP